MKVNAYVSLTLLVILAGIIRFHNAQRPPDDFHIVRQYNSLILIRGLQYPKNPIAAANYKNAQHAEFPLNEHFAARINRMTGSESYLAGRLLPILAWLAGAFFLFAIAQRIFQSHGPSYIALVYYLFSPFAIIASRSIQPDAMMVATLLFTLWTIVRYYEKLTAKRLIFCSLAASFAVFIKPGPSLFAIALVFALYSFKTFGIKKTFLQPSNYFFTFSAVAPSLLYSFARASDDLNHIVAGNFIPQWLLSFYFWKGWAFTLTHLAHPITMMMATLGLFALARTQHRSLICGYGLGYIILSLVSTLTTPSHDYWHLQIIPLFALGLGYVANFFLPWIQERLPKTVLYALIPIIFLYTIAYEFRRNVVPYYTHEDPEFIAFAQDIGNAVQHSTNCILLAYNYGRPECYYGNFAGRFWPETQDIWTASFHGQRLAAEERYLKFYAPSHPDYFIVSRNFPDFNKQPDLKDFLNNYTEVVKESARFVVYRFKPR